MLADAATQLGDTATATAAVQAHARSASRRGRVHPGVLRAGAARSRRRGAAGVGARLEAAIGRDELAFCQYYLGELAWGGGALEEARAHYERGLAAAPGDPALLQGRAKVLAAAGRVDEAITAYDRLTQRVPLPQYLLEYGELLESAGRLPEARPSTGCSTSSSGSTPRRARSTT